MKFYLLQVAVAVDLMVMVLLGVMEAVAVVLEDWFIVLVFPLLQELNLLL